jgi:hypothetical protein
VFGVHLVRKGILTEEQVMQALERQRGSTVSLGRLAFEHGYMDLDGVVAVLDRQRSEGGRFGELAVKMALLTEPQRDELLALQSRARLPLGQVLAEMGLVAPEVLATELDEYLASNEDPLE